MFIILAHERIENLIYLYFGVAVRMREKTEMSRRRAIEVVLGALLLSSICAPLASGGRPFPLRRALGKLVEPMIYYFYNKLLLYPPFR